MRTEKQIKTATKEADAELAKAIEILQEINTAALSPAAVGSLKDEVDRLVEFKADCEAMASGAACDHCGATGWDEVTGLCSCGVSRAAPSKTCLLCGDYLQVCTCCDQ